MPRRIIFEPSYTLSEFRLLPGLTIPECSMDNISLKTALVSSEKGQMEYFLNIPLVSAAMQSVSGVRMGIELARQGGVAFIYCSQPVEEQSEMVSKIKSFKAGFVKPYAISPETRIRRVAELRKQLGFATFPVVDSENYLLGIITGNDYELNVHADLTVADRMIKRDSLSVGVNITSLKKANELLIQSHHGVLPVVDDKNRLLYLVFRKDIHDHLDNPLEVVDDKKRLVAVAAINTYDFSDRVPALVEKGVDVVAIDSSDGHSLYQKQTLDWICGHYPGLPVIGGNVITPEGFHYLAEAGARAVKVGMGGGSICITQEQKGTGRGLATAVMEVAGARDEYFRRTGKYIPVVADGGVENAKDITIALAMGADYVMMGRFFARMDESPAEKVTINNRIMKPYWGEGSGRARGWKALRYEQAKFAEGVEGFVEYAGKLKDNLEETISKIKASMSSCGVCSIREFHEKAVLERVSAMSIREGQVHDVYLLEQDSGYFSKHWGD